MLPRANRLPKQDITEVTRYGSRVVGKDMVFLYKKTTGAPRFSLVVSTKVDKRATGRNRMRRIVSESVRHMLPKMGACDGVFIVKKNIAGMSQSDVAPAVVELLTKAHLL